MALTLDAAMRRLKLSDRALGDRCAPPVHRTQIWAYRTKRARPRSDTANVIIKAIAGLGIDLRLDDLLRAPAPKKKSPRRPAA